MLLVAVLSLLRFYITLIVNKKNIDLYLSFTFFFNLKSLKIGEIIIENIPCAVSNTVNGANLLGLSALRKLGSFEFDFNKATIKIK